MTPNSAPKRAIVLLGETFKRIDFRIDLLIFLSWYQSRTLAVSQQSQWFWRRRIEYHYDGTIRALVQILVDFLKALGFHHHQSILAALQPESSSPNRVQKPSNSFYLAYDFHPAYDSCKPLNPCNMAFTFVPADQFMEAKMMEWDGLLDNDLWDSFRDEFAEWTDEDFKLATITCQKKFRAYLRSRGVWVMKHERKTIAKSLHDVLQKETETPWIEEEIKRCMLTEHFTSNVINYLIETEFGRKSKDYSWQAQQRSESRHLGPRKFTGPRQSGSSKSTGPRIPSIQPRFPKFFQPPEFSSVFNRQLYSRLSPISSYRRSPTSSPISPRPSHLSSQNQLEKQLDGQQDKPSVEPADGLTVELPDEPLDESSVESPVESSDGPLDGPLDEPPDESPDGSLDEPPVGSSVKPLVESSDEPSVNQPFKSPRPSAPLTPVNQSRERSIKQPMGQPMRQLMSQLMRRSMNQPISDIHVRCGIGWIRGSLLNGTRQWLLNNRADETVLSSF